MDREYRICFIGGDQRMKYAAQNMQREGFILTEKIEDSNAVVLPIPYSVDGRKITGSDMLVSEVLGKMKKNQFLLLGRADDRIKEEADSLGIYYEDYGNREEFAVLNAIPTAEGAIEIAMRETEITLHSSKCLVMGNGRIGKILAYDLAALGADVTVSARKYKDFAWAEVYGHKYINYENLKNSISEYDIIFNTVPRLILDRELLKKVNAFVIDVASKPGGEEFYLDKVDEKE